MTATILVIDDSADDQRLYQRALKDSGYSLKMASTAEAGLALIADAKPDLILLDYNLPDMDGLGFMKRLAEYSDTPIPIVMLTGGGSEAVAIEAMKSGADDYLVKDTEGRYLKLLPGVVGRVMDVHAQREQTRRMQQENEELLHKLSAYKVELEMQNDELRRAQLTIEESRDRYVDLYDFAPIGYFTLTREALISEINLTGAALLGKERDKLIHSRFARFVAPEDSDRWHLHFMRTLQRGDQQSCELALRRDDGSSFHAQLDCLRQVNEGNAPVLRITLTDITERKQAETQTAKSISLLQATLESTNDAILVVDLNNTWMLHNQRFIDLWHIPDEIIAAKDDSAALSYVLNQLEDADGFLNKVRELYATPEASSFDMIKFKDGKIIERYSIPQLIDCKVVGRVWSFRDITERKQAEAVLRRHDVVIDTAIDGFWMTDVMGNLREANQAYAEMSGYSVDELVNMHISQLEAKEQSLEEVKAHIVKIIAQGYERFETRHRHKDGHEIDIEVSVNYLAESQQFCAFMRDITERKLFEEALRKSEEQLQFVSNNAPVSIAHCDYKQCYRFVNRTYAEMFGLQPADIIGKHLRDVLGEETYAHASPHIEAVLAGQPAEFDITLRATPGGSRKIHVSYAPERDASGQVVGFIAAIFDITERKRSEEELRVAAAAFETQDAIMITDADGNIIRVNRAFSDITGYSPEEVLGKNISIMNQGQYDDISCIEMLQQSIHDDLWTGEIWDKRKNGQIYPKWMTATAVRNEQQEIIRHVIIFSDITARKQIEKENLRESDERFRGTLEQAAVGIAHATLEGFFRQVNHKFCNIVGYTRDELLHMNFQDITFPADLGENLHYVQQLFAGEISTFSLEKRYVRKDQNLVWVNLTVSLLRDANGAPKYTIGVIEDISERKQTEMLVQQFGYLLQGSFNEIYLFDADSLHFLLTSEGAEQNLGYSDDELRQLTPLDLKPLFTRESFGQLVAPLRNGEQQSLSFETVHRRKDGTTYPVEVRLQFMQGETPVFLAVIQDITERKQADIELNQSRQLLRELVAQSEMLREEERKYIAREVHDELGQILTALRMNVSLLRIQFGGHDAALLEKIERITELLDQSIQCTRDVVNNLRPVALDMGIVPAVKWLRDEFIKHTGMLCLLYVPEEEIHLDEILSVVAFRVVQESLTNVARYAEANKVEIFLEQDANNFSVTVNDNGKGFDYLAISDHKSFGLLGMRERAIALGGVVNIYSAPQQGTQIFFVIPNQQAIPDKQTTPDKPTTSDTQSLVKGENP